MQLQENISLKPFNTFGIEAKARYFAPFTTLAELEELCSDKRENIGSRLILGGGSNILLTKDVDGIVLQNRLCGIEVTCEDEECVYVKAGAGENWHRFVMYCIEHGYAGVENLSLIPGSVGASPMQNIGAYGVEVKDIFHELEAYHLQERKLQKFTTGACAFGYRESVFKRAYKGQFVILSVTFRLYKKPRFNTSYGAIQQELDSMGVQNLTLSLVSQAVVNIRTSKLPDWKVVGNAGSFFKNPIVANEKFSELKTLYPGIAAFAAGAGETKLAAGWLIEQCGWKGVRRSDAGCYPKQALVLVNYGDATGAEVFALSEEIIQSVQQKFGVLLEREVNII